MGIPVLLIFLFPYKRGEEKSGDIHPPPHSCGDGSAIIQLWQASLVAL